MYRIPVTDGQRLHTSPREKINLTMQQIFHHPRGKAPLIRFVLRGSAVACPCSKEVRGTERDHGSRSPNPGKKKNVLDWPNKNSKKKSKPEAAPTLPPCSNSHNTHPVLRRSPSHGIQDLHPSVAGVIRAGLLSSRRRVIHGSSRTRDFTISRVL